MFSKILIANRGEVAVRVIRACKEMGVETVGVFSSADRDALHVALADESYCIGGPRPQDSYLNKEAILTVAIEAGATAIHPGYGFLAENAEFARMCRECGIVFVGPTPEVIERMGNKDMARICAREALQCVLQDRPHIPAQHRFIAKHLRCRKESRRKQRRVRHAQIVEHTQRNSRGGGPSAPEQQRRVMGKIHVHGQARYRAATVEKRSRDKIDGTNIHDRSTRRWKTASSSSPSA